MALDMMLSGVQCEPYEGFGKEEAKGYKMGMPDLRGVRSREQDYTRANQLVRNLNKKRTTEDSSQAEKDNVSKWWADLVEYANSLSDGTLVYKCAQMRAILEKNPYLQGLVHSGQADPIPTANPSASYHANAKCYRKRKAGGALAEELAAEQQRMADIQKERDEEWKKKVAALEEEKEALQKEREQFEEHKKNIATWLHDQKVALGEREENVKKEKEKLAEREYNFERFQNAHAAPLSHRMS